RAGAGDLREGARPGASRHNSYPQQSREVAPGRRRTVEALRIEHSLSSELLLWAVKLFRARNEMAAMARTLVVPEGVPLGALSARSGPTTTSRADTTQACPATPSPASGRAYRNPR